MPASRNGTAVAAYQMLGRMRSVPCDGVSGDGMLRAAYPKTPKCGCPSKSTAIIRAPELGFRNLTAGVDMQIWRVFVRSLFLCLFGGVAAVSAQLPAVKTDPLRPAQA